MAPGLRLCRIGGRFRWPEKAQIPQGFRRRFAPAADDGCGRPRWGEPSARRDGGARDGVEIAVDGARQDVDVDDRAVLVLYEVDDAGHREGVVVTDDDDPVRGDERGVASFAQPRPDVAGLVLVVEVDLQVDHDGVRAHAAHLLFDRVGSYFGLSSTGPRISSRSARSPLSARSVPSGGWNRTVQWGAWNVGRSRAISASAAPLTRRPFGYVRNLVPRTNRASMSPRAANSEIPRAGRPAKE